MQESDLKMWACELHIKQLASCKLPDEQFASQPICKLWNISVCTLFQVQKCDKVNLFWNDICFEFCFEIRNDLKIYKKFELESTFIEIVNPRKSNIIVGVIYKHPKMDVTDFNNNFLNNLLKKINQEQKKCFF